MKLERYEFFSEKSAKFWEIQVAGSSLTTTYGRIGSKGQSTQKKYASTAAAKAAAKKAIAQKLRKGYVAALTEREALLLAKDDAASMKQLRNLIGRAPKVDRQLAMRRDISATLLGQLSESNDRPTRRNVARNEKANRKTLLFLAREFPAELFDNAQFPGLMIDRPDLFQKLNEYNQERLQMVIKLLRAKLQGDAAILASIIVDQKTKVPRGLGRGRKLKITDPERHRLLAIALVRRARKYSDWMLLFGADMVKASDLVAAALRDVGLLDDKDFEYGVFSINGRKYPYYPQWLLADAATLQTRDGQVQFWQDIAIYDERPNSRKIALKRIAALGNQRDVKLAKSRRAVVVQKTKKHEASLDLKTNEFRKRIKALFRALKPEGIFGVDARNLGGWDPSDHWWETAYVAFEAMSAKNRRFFETLWGEDGVRYCYVDTQWEVEQVTKMVGNHPVRVGFCNSVHCYFFGQDEDDSHELACSIVKAGPKVGIAADWPGEVHLAITLCEPPGGIAHRRVRWG